ncbi:MAG: hypothetical protein KW788_00945 [Candidatus Doudnabacteria bacterium]|nr:hypothetical protein [Candidatus Doudnabacteria bacterium]
MDFQEKSVSFHQFTADVDKLRILMMCYRTCEQPKNTNPDTDEVVNAYNHMFGHGGRCQECFPYAVKLLSLLEN